MPRTRYGVYNSKGGAKGTSAAAVAELDKAIVAELSKTKLGQDFTITNTAGKIKLEAKEIGTNVPTVKSMDSEWTVGGTRATEPKIGVTAKDSVDTDIEIKADELTLYNGQNYDDTVFTINGNKFVLLTDSHTGADLGAEGTI